MASLLSKLSAGQLWELNSDMARLMTAEEALKLLGDKEAWKSMVAVLRERPPFRLAHGVGRLASEVLEEENRRLIEVGHKLDQFIWIGSSEPPERTDGLVDQRLHFVRARDVRVDERGLSAGLLDQPHGLLAAFVRDIGNDDVRVPSREGEGRSSADARSGTRDQGDLAVELSGCNHAAFRSLRARDIRCAR